MLLSRAGQTLRRSASSAAQFPHAWDSNTILQRGRRFLPPIVGRRRRRAHCSATAAPSPAAAGETADGIASTSAAPPHVSVLLDEILGFFEGKEIRTYVDGTLGAGGHAAAVLRSNPNLQTLVGFDLDPTAHALASAALHEAGAHIIPVSVDKRSQVVACEHATAAAGRPAAYLVRSNYSAWGPVLGKLPPGGSLFGGVDAALLDLGISSMQVDTAERGFSFLRDGPLDMRMDPGAALSAEDVVNTWTEAQLGAVIRDWGEERHWRGIARRIASFRESEPIRTTHQLVRAVGDPGGASSRGRGRGGRSKSDRGGYKHPATRVFQALRIAVNQELQSIAAVLPAAVESLAPGGRLAVITFHSLEDRIVKWAFRRAAGMAPSDEPLPAYCLPFTEDDGQAQVRILTKRPVVPSDEEQAANPRSRSAKLRVVEKL